eukprot:c21934_g1_i1 orf=66-698(+)
MATSSSSAAFVSSSMSWSCSRCAIASHGCAFLPPNRPPRTVFQPRKVPSVVRECSASGDGLNAEIGKGKNIWQKELEVRWKEEENAGLLLADEALLHLSIEQDIQRLGKQREAERREQRVLQGETKANREDGYRKGILGTLVEKLLIADFFFILFFLGWFLVGLAEMAAFDTSSLIDTWFLLWATIFQPALGIFIASAILTGLSSFLRKL